MLENCRNFFDVLTSDHHYSQEHNLYGFAPTTCNVLHLKWCALFFCVTAFQGHLKGKTQLWPDFGPPMVLHWTGQESSQSPHSPFTCSPWSLCDVLGEIKQLGCDCDLIWFDSPDDQFLCCTKVCRCCQPKRIWCDKNDLLTWCSILWQTGVWGTWQSALALLCQGPHTSNIGGLIFFHHINLWWQRLQFWLTVVHWVYCIPLYWKGKTHCCWSTVKHPAPPFCKRLSLMGQLFFTIFVTFVFMAKLSFLNIDTEHIILAIIKRITINFDSTFNPFYHHFPQPRHDHQHVQYHHYHQNQVLTMTIRIRTSPPMRIVSATQGKAPVPSLTSHLSRK